MPVLSQELASLAAFHEAGHPYWQQNSPQEVQKGAPEEIARHRRSISSYGCWHNRQRLCDREAEGQQQREGQQDAQPDPAHAHKVSLDNAQKLEVLHHVLLCAYPLQRDVLKAAVRAEKSEWLELSVRWITKDCKEGCIRL